MGVAEDFDILAGYIDWKGVMTQYVYVPTSKTGTCNIKVRYGHRLYTGIPSVGIYPAGLSVTPESNTEYLDYGLTFSY